MRKAELYQKISNALDVIPDEDLDNALNEVIALAPRYQQIKEGNLKPQRCGDCPYCRFTEVLTEPVNYHEELEVYDVECG